MNPLVFLLPLFIRQSSQALIQEDGLVKAIRERDEITIDTLLDVNYDNSFLFACEMRDIEIASKYLASQKVSKSAVSNALLLAADQNNIEIAQLLFIGPYSGISQFYEPSYRDWEAVLLSACSNGHIEIAEMASDFNGAIIPPGDARKQGLTYTGDYGRTLYLTSAQAQCLAIALNSDDDMAFQKLIQSPKIRPDSINEISAFVVKLGCNENFKAFLAKNPSHNALIMAFKSALRSNNELACAFILDQPSFLNLNNYSYALLYTCISGNLAIFNRLIQHEYYQACQAIPTILEYVILELRSTNFQGGPRGRLVQILRVLAKHPFSMSFFQHGGSIKYLIAPISASASL